MKYTIVTEESFETSFVVKINKLLEIGWKLQGGVSVTVTNGNCKVFCQALYCED